MRRAAKTQHLIRTQELTENRNEFGKILKWIIKRCLNTSEAESQLMKQLDDPMTPCVKVASEDKVTAENMRLIFCIYFFFTVKAVGKLPACTAFFFFFVADWLG